MKSTKGKKTNATRSTAEPTSSLYASHAMRGFMRSAATGGTTTQSMTETDIIAGGL